MCISTTINDKASSIISVATAAGNVTIYFEIPETESYGGIASGAPGSSRTILPVSSEYFKYDLKFINEDLLIKEISKSNEDIPIGEYSIDLVLGTWTIEVIRKEIDGKGNYLPVAQGSGEIELTSEAAIKSVIIDLTPIPDGTGVFEYNIKLNADSAFLASVKGEISIKSVINGLVDTKIIIDSFDAGPTPGQISGQSPELNAGEYDVIISLTNTKNNTKTGEHNVAHIYTGMKTTGNFEFSKGHFVDHVNLAGSIDNTNIAGIITPVSVKVEAHIPGTGSLVGEPETYDWFAPHDPITWMLSIPPNIPSVYFTVSVTDIYDRVYNHEMKDSPLTDITASGRRNIELSPYIYTIDAFVSNANSIKSFWTTGLFEQRTAASPDEEVSLYVESDYGFKLGSLEFSTGGPGTAISGSSSPYSFVMPDGHVSLLADFYTANLDSLYIIPGNDTLVISGTDEYTANIPNTETKIQIFGISNEGAAISLSGPYNSLDTGENEIIITVTPVNPGGTVLKGSRNYTLTVTRAESQDCDLADLTVSEGTLTPAFNSAQTYYTVNVGYDVDKIDIDAVENNALSVINGDTGTDLPLSVGANTFTITVTAEDSSTKEYTIVVTREKDSNNKLVNLTVSPGILTHSSGTGFDENIFDYDVIVPYTVSSLTIDAEAPENGTVLGTGSYALTVGLKTFTVTGVAQNDSQQNYTINVTRSAPAPAELSDLTVYDGIDTYSLSNFKITEDNTTTPLSYKVTVDNSATYVDVTPLPVTGALIISGTVTSYNLNAIGETIIYIDVLPESGIYQDLKTYTLIIELGP